jgi:hypothetical protein
MSMAKEDVIGITVNGENVANFSIPVIGHKVKLDEYQFTHVGGVHEVSVALVKDASGKELSITDKVVALEIMKEESADFSATQISKEDAPTSGEIVPVAEPAKKPRKPREPKVKTSEEIPVKTPEEIPIAFVAPVVETPRATEPVVTPAPAPQVVSSDVNTARLPYLVKMIGFYARAKELKKEDITVELLKKDALDIVEKDSDQTIRAAIDALKL